MQVINVDATFDSLEEHDRELKDLIFVVSDNKFDHNSIIYSSSYMWLTLVGELFNNLFLFQMCWEANLLGFAS